jgi:hypothetical protein
VKGGKHCSAWSLLSPEDGKTSSFRNVVFSRYLEFLTMENFHKPGDLRGEVFCAGPRNATVCGTVGSGVLYLVFAEDLERI